ncbi:hypothetical protein E0H73_42995 [Kribbella pittospori]|uniref:Restriction endonuclease n=1 Tax=Kribbella pittospori TaxID=722689 RepID=A0A4R0JLP2_9ACTN|nr:hypothetical protein [Kribbella pittospori]TCC48051.1 hypothetical protein E0H73_42995 [Kribbella pittospori]
MPNPLFSTYRGGENRVTSSLMAVFERMDLALVQELLEAATGTGEELRTVTFENQVVNVGAVPDARISARFTWWFETKTARGGYATEGHDRHQVRVHARQLEDDPHARLFVLTPDPAPPAWFDRLDGVNDAVRQQVVWLSFKDLADAIVGIMADPNRLIGEQTRFLLTELVALFEADGLLTNDDAVVVAARSAWQEYLDYSAYICQPDRTFREGISHFGFYYHGSIQSKVAKIHAYHPAVPFTRTEADRRRNRCEDGLADLIEQVLAAGARIEGDSHGVMLLSGPSDNDTVHLDAPIVNDTKTEAGKPWAWTLGQRYTRLDRLRSGVSRTSQL